MIKESIRHVSSYLTQSKLPGVDFVINPYIGCPHKCIYCYAEFMRGFTGHIEPWGNFVDIKIATKKINTKRLIGKTIVISSVTDPYNIYEKGYKLTRQILEQLIGVDTHVQIITKSDLVLRDIDILKELNSVSVALSVNNLEDVFSIQLEPYAPLVSRRLSALQSLHKAGIYTTLFMSPLMPYFSNFVNIIEASKDFVDEYWFENLNLRNEFKVRVLQFIHDHFSKQFPVYHRIYNMNNNAYWLSLSKEIDEYCQSNNIKYKNLFHYNSN